MTDDSSSQLGVSLGEMVHADLLSALSRIVSMLRRSDSYSSEALRERLQAAQELADLAERSPRSQKLFCEKLGMSEPTLSRWIGIGRDERLRDAKLLPILPMAYSILSAIARLTDEELAYAIEAGIIHQDVRRSEIEDVPASFAITKMSERQVARVEGPDLVPGTLQSTAGIETPATRRDFTLPKADHDVDREPTPEARSGKPTVIALIPKYLTGAEAQKIAEDLRRLTPLSCTLDIVMPTKPAKRAWKRAKKGFLYPTTTLDDFEITYAEKDTPKKPSDPDI